MTFAAFFGPLFNCSELNGAVFLLDVIGLKRVNGCWGLTCDFWAVFCGFIFEAAEIRRSEDESKGKWRSVFSERVVQFFSQATANANAKATTNAVVFRFAQNDKRRSGRGWWYCCGLEGVEEG